MNAGMTKVNWQPVSLETGKLFGLLAKVNRKSFSDCKQKKRKAIYWTETKKSITSFAIRACLFY